MGGGFIVFIVFIDTIFIIVIIVLKPRSSRAHPLKPGHWKHLFHHLFALRILPPLPDSLTCLKVKGHFLKTTLLPALRCGGSARSCLGMKHRALRGAAAGRGPGRSRGPGGRRRGGSLARQGWALDGGRWRRRWQRWLPGPSCPLGEPGLLAQPIL